LSRLVSRDDADVQAAAPVTLNLRDVEQQVREAVDRARGEARKILAESVARAREMERVAAARGEKAGYDAGLRRGQELGRAEALEAEKKRLAEATATVRDALIETLAELENRRHQVLADAQLGLLELAIAIAERVCRAKLQGGGEHLKPLLNEIIEMTGCQAGLVLRLNPADVVAVEQFLADIHGAISGGEAAAVRLLPDAQVERGGCVAERASGKVDARLQTQIDRIVSELAGGPLGRPPISEEQT